MKYWVYVLQSERDSSLYVGLSENPLQRLREHNAGYSKFTKERRPYKLVYREECKDRLTARRREKYFKTGFGKEYLKKIIPL